MKQKFEISVHTLINLSDLICKMRPSNSPGSYLSGFNNVLNMYVFSMLKVTADISNDNSFARQNYIFVI